MIKSGDNTHTSMKWCCMHNACHHYTKLHKQWTKHLAIKWNYFKRLQYRLLFINDNSQQRHLNSRHFHHANPRVKNIMQEFATDVNGLLVTILNDIFSMREVTWAKARMVMTLSCSEMSNNMSCLNDEGVSIWNLVGSQGNFLQDT